MTIPLLDLTRQLGPIRDEIDAAICRVLNESKFILGPDVQEFEKQMASYCGTEFAIGVASGTDALMIALKALGVGHGDEVITTSYSFFATASAIWRLGARPVFVDIVPATYNIDPENIPAKITPKTKAILVVHLFGQLADMDRIKELSGDIPIIEDAAQAIGATWRGRPAGQFGRAGCFSFFPSKNLGGFGDGGMVVTSDRSFAERCHSLRVHGALSSYIHEEVGYNSRLDTLQAAVLQVKLKYLEKWSAQRRENAQFYHHAFKDSPVVTPTALKETKVIYNQYVIRVPERDKLRDRLRTEGIGHAVYYPLPLPLQPCFKALHHIEGDFPEAEKAAEESVAIPVFSDLSSEELQKIVSVILDHASQTAIPAA